MPMNGFRKFSSIIRSKKGQGMVEYVFIIGFIALAAILSLTQLGTALEAKFTEFAALING